MSRFKRYAHSLASGYVLLGVNLVYTLVSVPLALHYLTTAEFGLWALVLQFAGYILLIDAGMTTAVSRILVDYKNEPHGDNYGNVIKTGFLVNLAQAAIVLLVSPILVWFARSMPGVPAELTGQFGWLMVGQCVYVAVSLLGRTFANLLWAHQRTDIANYIQSVGLIVSLAVQWVSLALGSGVYAVLWTQASWVLIGLVLSGVACGNLKLFPQKGRWGPATWTRFRELFGFGKDAFLSTLGSQMINASQIIVVTMCLGLDAAAVWSVCVRGYNLLTQLVWRVMDYSATPLSEMLVLGEAERLARRFRQITLLTTVAAILGAVLFAACNQPFVTLWTHGKMGWSPGNDVLLAVWLVLMAVQRCHCGLLGVRKDLRVVKYLYFLEGILFLELGFAFGSQGGFPAIIASSLLATLAVSFRYGLHRTRADFHLSWPQMLEWWAPASRLALILVPLALGLWWVARYLPAWAGLGLLGGGIGLVGGWLMLRWGLDSETKAKLKAKIPFATGLLFGQ